jgi:hypothetical protein
VISKDQTSIKMEENQQEGRHCLNCNHPLNAEDKFCPNCAQKVTDGKISVREFVLELLDAIYSLDSRLWRTLRDIWIPGKLSLEYFKGKHRTYMHPLRFFILTAIVHFAIISYRTSDWVTVSLQEGPDFIKREQAERKFITRIDSIGEKIVANYPENQEVEEAIDTLIAHSGSTIDTFLNGSEIIFGTITNSKGEEVKVPFLEYYKYTAEELAEKYDVNSFYGKLILKQQLRAANHPDGIYRSILANFIWMILIMMPALALVLKLLYLRARRYYVEHLVFSFHFHAFSFLVVSPFYLFLPSSQIATLAIPFLAILIYLFLSMKQFYKQGFFTTFLKWFFLLNGYWILFFFFFMGTFILSFFIQ